RRLAEKHHRQAIQLYQELATEFPSYVGFRTNWNLSIQEWIPHLRATGEEKEVAIALQKLHDGYQQLVAENATETNLLRDYAHFLVTIGKTEEAQKAYRRALERFQKLAEEQPGNILWPYECVGIAHALSRLLQESKRLDEAVTALRQSVAYQERTCALAP